jgi:hypothetical protein
MSKSSTISLDVLNALSPQKECWTLQLRLENQVFTFHSIVAPAENCGSYCCQRWQLVCESSLYQFKNKKSFLIPIRGLLNLGIVQMGTTKVKALDPKAEVAKWMIIYLKINWW